MPKEDFSYKNLNGKLLPFIESSEDEVEQIKDRELGYIAARGDGEVIKRAFIYMKKIGANSADVTLEGEVFKEYKLQFHISLPESDRVKYAQAWDIAKDILIENQVGFFKVAHERTKMSAKDGSQRGKDITIYAQSNPEKSLQDWQNILTDITEKLVRADIPPGYETSKTGLRADTAINGSNYIS